MVQEMNLRKRGENWSKVYGPYLIYLNIRQVLLKLHGEMLKAVAKVEKAKKNGLIHLFLNQDM